MNVHIQMQILKLVRASQIEQWFQICYKKSVIGEFYEQDKL